MGLYAIVWSLYCVQLSMSLSTLEYPTTLYSLPALYRPAFGSFLFNPLTGETDYAYSSFTGLITEPDKILRIPSVSSNYQDKTKMKSYVVTEDIKWPNEVGMTPEGAFGTHYWTSASAFFLPGKDNGSISLIDMTDPYNVGEPIAISPFESEKKWYYHRVLWQDMDNDGDMDAVTARAYGNATEAYEAQLVWFENPGTTEVTPGWDTHIIFEGYEDVSFRLHNFPLPDGTETLVIISAGFFETSLTLTWTTDGDWTNSDSIQHRVIDNFGWYFDLQISDINNDGSMDIVASTWSRPGVRYFGSLVAYQMPDDWRTGRWIRHVISTDFRSIYLLQGNGAPGGMTVFWPSKQMELGGEKPHIILSGDDDGHAYLFVPTSQDTEDWSYTKSTIFRAFGTVGAIAVADIDNDGYSEIFVPAYSADQIIVMSYKP